MSAETFQPKQSLGVLNMISNGMAMLFRNPILLIGVAVVVQLFWTAVNYALSLGFFGVNIFDITAVLSAQSDAAYQTFSTILSIVSYIISVGIITLAAIDAYNGYGMRFGFYVKQTASKFFVILIISALVYFLAALPVLLGVGLSAYMGETGAAILVLVLMVAGFVFFFYMYAMFSMTTLAILVDGAGFGALGRSRFLTKSYRGSITGVYLILTVFLIILLLIVSAALGLFGAGSAANIQFLVQGVTGSPLFQISNLFVGSALVAYFAAVNVSIFERLRAIKEGVGLVEVANVFD